MRKIFWENPYLHTLKTKVTFVDGCKVLFEETIVYSENGGQESDIGTINGMPILHSVKEDNENLIYYFLPDGHGLKVGDIVEMKIDWERRYRLMRLHFACEIVLELVTQNFMKKQDSNSDGKKDKTLHDRDKPQFEVGDKTGAHMHADKARIDFRCVENISAILGWILKEYNEIIKSNRRIELGYTDIKTQKRYWKIDGFGQVPCGGTHVRSTGEVGYVTLKRERVRKGEERIVILPLDNAVPAFTFFAHKEFKPLLPEGLNYTRINIKGLCLTEAAAYYLRISPQEVRKRIAIFIRKNPQEVRSILEKLKPSSALSEGEIEQQLVLFEQGLTWPEIDELNLLSLASQRMITIITPGGIEIINDLKFPTSDPIFVFSNKNNHYDGIIIREDINPKEVLTELKRSLPTIKYIEPGQIDVPKVLVK